MEKPQLIALGDDPDVADIIENIGDSVGYEVRTADSARKFQCACLETKPSTIIVNVVMPKMDGIQLLEWLAEKGCTASIIIMTGYDKSFLDIAEDIGTSRGLKIAGTLTKPFLNYELEAMLKIILEVAE